ncbi:WXG100 family type VII secretion target [Anaerosporobacter sp.]
MSSGNTTIIQMTPSELESAATYLEERKDAIISEITLLDTKLNELETNWKGAAQSQFMDTFDVEIKPVLTEKLPEIIEGIEGQLRGSAKALEQADKDIADLLKIQK